MLFQSLTGTATQTTTPVSTRAHRKWPAVKADSWERNLSILLSCCLRTGWGDIAERPDDSTYKLVAGCYRITWMERWLCGVQYMKPKVDLDVWSERRKNTPASGQKSTTCPSLCWLKGSIISDKCSWYLRWSTSGGMWNTIYTVCGRYMEHC